MHVTAICGNCKKFRGEGTECDDKFVRGPRHASHPGCGGFVPVRYTMRRTGSTTALMLRAISDAMIYGRSRFVDHPGSPDTFEWLKCNMRRLRQIIDELGIKMSIENDGRDAIRLISMWNGAVRDPCIEEGRSEG